MQSIHLQQSQRILIVGPAWVGDMVMAQSLFMALKKQRPDCHIDVLAPAWTLSLLERMPQIRQAVCMPAGRGELALWKRLTWGVQLRSADYDQAILLPNSWKSALLPLAADIPQRTGYLGELRWGLLNDIRVLDEQRLPMTVQRFVALAYPAGDDAIPDCPVPRLAIAGQKLAACKKKFQIQHSDKILALCPGAEYGPAKRWPAGYYAQLAIKKIQQGWQVWLFGSVKDQAVCAEIKQTVQQDCRDFSGQTSMAEAVDLMSLVDLVISNDSGLMHVAAALDKPLIAIYGSSDPNFTPPLNDKSKIVTLALPCSPCFKRECPLGHSNCLREISVQRVLTEIKGFF